VEVVPEILQGDTPALQGANLAVAYFSSRAGGDLHDFLRVSPQRFLFGKLENWGQTGETGENWGGTGGKLGTEGGKDENWGQAGRSPMSIRRKIGERSVNCTLRVRQRNW
jgi:hypothetical protein